MSALTSLLVRDQVVSVRKIEEAIQRQVMSGGDLESVLLEMEVVPEDVMAAYRAALFGLLPATREEVMRVARDTIRLVPRDVALQYRLVPLWAEKRTLVVAVTTPLEADVDAQLGFLLGHELVYRIVAEVRLLAGLGHHYAFDVPPRMRRLAEKLRHRDPGTVPYVAPPNAEKVDAASGEIPRKRSDLPSMIDWDDDDERASQPGTEGRETRKFGRVDQRPEQRRSEGGVGMGRVVGVGPGKSSPPPALTPAPGSVPAAAAAPDSAAAPASPRRSDTKPSSPLLRRLRGPLTPSAAVELLGEAESRDQILEVFFAFCRQFFDYAALFVVHDEVADGREAWGAGPDSTEVSRLAVPLDVPGSFARVREAGQPRVVDLTKSDLDRIVANDLRRAEMQPAAIVPLTIRGRVVLVLYGDRGGDAFGLSDLPELMAFLPRVSDAFQKLILKQKFKGYGGSGGGEAEPRSGAESSPAAESRSALKAAASRMGAVAPPPTRVDSYRPSGVPGGAARLADAVSAEPPQRAPAAPTASPEPTTSDPEEPPASTGPQRPRRRKKRIDTQPRPPQEGPLGILGVPRSAPPPPIPNAVDDAEERVDKTTRPDGQAATASMRLRKDTRPDRFPAFAAVHDSAPDAGDEPELSFEPVDETDPDLADLDDVEDATSRGNGRPVAPQGGGSYSMRDASTEVLGSRGGTRRREGQSDRPKSAGDTDRPPAARRRSTNRPPRLGDRTDPRREADGGAVVHEVVRLPRGAAAISAPSEQPAGETPEPVLARHSTPESDPAPGEPTVIVDMGDTVEALVDDLVQCGPDDEGAAVESLTHAGEAALPALVQRFPGPLWFDRYQPHKRLPRGRDVSAVARAMVRFGDRSVPYVASLVGSRDADIRFYATLLASEIVHRDLLFPLAQRIFDEDAGTRTLVLDVLRLFSKWDRDFEEMLKAVRVEARVDRADPDRRLAAIRALGELRDARSVELLAALLDLGDPEITEGAHGALVTIARQDFGDSARKWIGWLERNQDRHRIEWLIDALLHPDEDIRTAAGEELKSSTQEYHGYHPASPRRDREIAQRKYRTWWDSQGQRRFAR